MRNSVASPRKRSREMCKKKAEKLVKSIQISPLNLTKKDFAELDAFLSRFFLLNPKMFTDLSEENRKKLQFLLERINSSIQKLDIQNTHISRFVSDCQSLLTQYAKK